MGGAANDDPAVQHGDFCGGISMSEVVMDEELGEPLTFEQAGMYVCRPARVRPRDACSVE